MCGIRTAGVHLCKQRGKHNYPRAAHAHLHTMPKESSFPAAEKLPLPGTESYICNLIDHTGEATSWMESVPCAPHGSVAASLPCPAPARCHSLHWNFGSAAGCSPGLELGGRLDLSDALIISCPIPASYLVRKTLHLRSAWGFVSFLFLGRKKNFQ